MRRLLTMNTVADKTQIAAYLSRINCADRPSSDAAGLIQLQEAHRRSIAFESLDIGLGRPITIDSKTVFDKLVTRGRGGYCFEQNRLFSDMLAALGFANRPLLARVLLGLPEGEVPPRTHVLLLTQIGEEQWIADAGFGGSYVPPMRLIHGEEVQTDDGANHRLLLTDDNIWRLERAGPAETGDGRAFPHLDWQAQYVFDLREVEQADLEQCNHWTSTRAGTRFTDLRLVSIVQDTDLRGAGFAFMSDLDLSISGGGKTDKYEISDPAEYRQVLADIFGLELSAAEVARLPMFLEDD